MNKKPDRREQLLAELFHANWTEGPTGNFARLAAAHARRRRFARRSLAGIGAAAAILALLFLASVRRSPSPQAVNVPTKATAGYEIISDDELLAQLHDRPLLAVREENGTRKFVLLEN